LYGSERKSAQRRQHPQPRCHQNFESGNIDRDRASFLSGLHPSPARLRTTTAHHRHAHAREYTAQQEEAVNSEALTGRGADGLRAATPPPRGLQRTDRRFRVTLLGLLSLEEEEVAAGALLIPAMFMETTGGGEEGARTGRMQRRRRRLGLGLGRTWDFIAGWAGARRDKWRADSERWAASDAPSQSGRGEAEGARWQATGGRRGLAWRLPFLSPRIGIPCGRRDKWPAWFSSSTQQRLARRLLRLVFGVASSRLCAFSALDHWRWVTMVGGWLGSLPRRTPRARSADSLPRLR
jgi:hypothetical protein